MAVHHTPDEGTMEAKKKTRIFGEPGRVQKLLKHFQPPLQVQNENPSEMEEWKTNPHVNSDTKSIRPSDIQLNAGPIPKAVVHPLKPPLVPKPLVKPSTIDLSEKRRLQNTPDRREGDLVCGESKINETTTFPQNSNDSAPVAGKLNKLFENSKESSSLQAYPTSCLDPPEIMNNPVLVIQDENDSRKTSFCPDVILGQELEKNMDLPEVLADQKQENCGGEEEEMNENLEEIIYDDVLGTHRVSERMNTEKPLVKPRTIELSEKRRLQNTPERREGDLVCGESKIHETTTFAQNSNDSTPVAGKLNKLFGKSKESSSLQAYPTSCLDPPEIMNKPVLVIQDENDSRKTSSCPDVILGQELEKYMDLPEVLADQKQENCGGEEEEIYENLEENIYDDVLGTHRVSERMNIEKFYKKPLKEKSHSKSVLDIEKKNNASGGCKSGENEFSPRKKNMRTLLFGFFKTEAANCNVSCNHHVPLVRNNSDCTENMNKQMLLVENDSDDWRNSCSVFKPCHEAQKKMDLHQVLANEKQRYCDDVGEEALKNVEENMYDDVEISVERKWEMMDHSQSPRCIKQSSSCFREIPTEAKEKEPKKLDETDSSEKQQSLTLWYLFENESELGGKGIARSEGESFVPKRDLLASVPNKKSIPNGKNNWKRQGAVIRRTYSDNIDKKSLNMQYRCDPRTSSCPLPHNCQESKKNQDFLEVPMNLKQEQEECNEDVHEKDEGNVFIEVFPVPVPMVEEMWNCLWQNLPRVQNSGLLNTLSEKELKRQEVMYELYTTERQFHSKVQFVIHHFVNSEELGHAITPHDKRFLFSNLGDVFDASTRFLEALQQRIQEVQISGVCDIVLKYTNGDFQKFVSYIRNQPYQTDTFKKLCKLNTSFSEIINKLSEHPKSGKLPLSAHLLLPMQRLTRLQLLIERILKYTEEDSEEEHLSQATLDALIKVIRKSNEDLRRMKQTEELVHILNKIDFKDLKCIPIACQSRYLIKEGELHELKSIPKGNFKNAIKKGQQKAIYIFLFNDLILLTKKTGMKYEVFDYAPRVMIEIQELPEAETTAENAFQLVLLENHKQKQIELAFQASSLNDKERWISAISCYREEEGHTIYEDWDCPKVCCICNYSAQQADELEMAIGDVIKVTKKTKDAWFQGERIWDDAVGWFPSTYVKEINNEHVRARHLRQRYRLLCTLAPLYENK